MICNKSAFTSPNKLFFVLLAFASIVVSCERAELETVQEQVSWPEITRFDDIAFRADGYVRVEDISGVREVLADLLLAGKALTKESIPTNVADPQQVELILGDLSNLVSGLAAEELDDATLADLVLGLHPVIAKLIDAAGMPHVHANEGPNSGFLFPAFDGEGKQTGTIEIKLHDDAGDLEVWLKKGGYEGEPWRLPLDTTLTLDFPAESKTVTLVVRDTERNEDESGESTIFEGATNYFIFPGETGTDASWLMGADFAAKVELSFAGATTGSFVLRPHVHRKDGE
jgi:hypothetical protein